MPYGGNLLVPILTLPFIKDVDPSIYLTKIYKNTMKGKSFNLPSSLLKIQIKTKQFHFNITFQAINDNFAFE